MTNKHNSNADLMTSWQTPAGRLPLDVAADNAALESLRNFAVTHGELQFAHLVTAAINGEAWAAERVHAVLANGISVSPSPALAPDVAARGVTVTPSVAMTSSAGRLSLLDMIRATDCTRPDGAIARGIEI